MTALDEVTIESIINREDGSLPFGYFEPESEGKLTWNCGYDADMRIISIFCYDYGITKDKKISILPSMDDAIFAKTQLIDAGWLQLKAPEIVISYDGEKKPLSRKQKRLLARKVKNMSKRSPFEEDE